VIFTFASSNFNPVKKIKLVMFDFDGTLVDTAPDIVTATNQLLINHGHPMQAPEVIKQDIGTGLKKLLLDFFPEARDSTLAEAELTQEFLEIYRSVFLNSPHLFPGAELFLREISSSQGLKVAIVSNKREQLIHPILKKLQLSDFPWVKIIGGDTFSVMKPDPLPLISAINAAGVKPSEAVIVGDGTPDIEGALAAQCRSVAVSFGYTPIDQLMKLGATARIDDFSELWPVIKRLSH
jgi:phosphoglycolate phosphatase